MSDKSSYNAGVQDAMVAFCSWLSVIQFYGIGEIDLWLKQNKPDIYAALQDKSKETKEYVP